MFALVSGAPSEVRMASDQAFSLSPFGVSYSAVGCGVSPPESVEGWLAWVVGCWVAGCCVGVAALDGVCDGLGLCGAGLAGIFAVAKPSGLALACSSELAADTGAGARVAASGTFGAPEDSGDGTAPTATATPTAARAAAT